MGWMRLGLMVTFLLAALGGVAKAQDLAEEEFRYARSLADDRRELGAAARKFAAFVKAHPRHRLAADALSYMGYCYAHLGQDASAAEAYSQLLVTYPQARPDLREEALAYGGDAYFKLQRFEKAIELYDSLLKDFPRSTHAEAALLWRAEAWAAVMQTRDQAGQSEAAKEALAKALGNYEEFLKRYPESKKRPAALHGAGLTCFDAQAYAKAIRFLGRLVQEFEDDERVEPALRYIAESYYWAGDYPKARNAFLVLLKRYPKGDHAADARAGMAWCDHAEGKYKEAAESFAAAARLYGENREKALGAQLDAGLACREAGLIDRARFHLRQVADAQGHPGRGQALLALGRMDREEGLRAEAAQRDALLDRAAQRLRLAWEDEGIGEHGPEAGALLGQTLLERGHPGEANKVLTALIEKAPDHELVPFALYHLALAQGRGGETAEAVNTLRRLLKDYRKARFRLQAAYAMADFRARLGEIKPARGAYRWVAEAGIQWAEEYRDESGQADADLVRTAKELAPDSLYRLGESYAAEGRADEARHWFQRLLETYRGAPQRTYAQLRLGELAESQSQWTEARDWFESALAGAGEDKDAVRHARLRLAASLLRLGRAKSGTEGADLCRSALETLEPLTGLVDKALRSEWLFLRAEAMAGLEKAEAAVALYKQCLEVAPTGRLADAAWYGLAWLHQSRGESDAALKAYQQVVDRFPDSTFRADALVALAALKRSGGEAEKALADADRVASMTDDAETRARAKLEAARALQAMDRADEAVQALEAFRREYPTLKPDAVLWELSWARWALVEPKLKEAVAAEDALKAARGKESAAGVKRLEVAANAARDAARSAEDRMAMVLRELIEDHGSSQYAAGAYLRLGEIAFDRGHYEAARKAFDKALERAKDPSRATEARYRLAWAALRASEVSAPGAVADEESKATNRRVALDAFAEVAKSNGALAPSAAYQAGELKRVDGDAEAALVWYEQASDGAKKEMVQRGALHGLGRAKLDLGHHQEALGVFKQFLETYPSGQFVPEARWGAGAACLALGADKDAADYFNAARAEGYAGEVAARARLGLGLIAERRGDWEAARDEYRKIDVFHAHWPEVAAKGLLKASQVSLELDQPETARKDLRRIIDRYGETTVAVEARGMLRDIPGEQADADAPRKEAP